MGKLQSIFVKANFQVVDNSNHLQPEEAEKKFNMLVKKGIDKFMKKPMLICSIIFKTAKH